MLRRKAILLILVGTLTLALVIWASQATTVPAAPLFQDTPTPAPAEAEAAPTRTPVPNLSISDEYCLSCHGQPGQTYTLGNGDVLDLYTPAELHQNSVHGETGIACVQCHADVGEYPHPAWQAVDRRDATLVLNAVCQRCHNQQHELTQDGVHVSVRASGNRAGATCSDCHTAHEIPRLNDPETHELLPEARTWIPERCGLCHNAIYQKYKESVHGSALTEGNPDVPTCIDCHGVHNIEDPRTAAFRLKSPDMCAKCHADTALMEKYGVSTEVFNTYVADFHGTTVTIFEKEHPNAEVNKAVCYDCHGVHDIGRTDDPHVGLQMQDNLLTTCKTCHPDATSNFTAAWMSHFIPSPDKFPLVYYVNLFYSIFIPVTLGGMALLVVMDASRSYLNRWRKRQKKAAVEAPKEDEEAQETEVQGVEAQAAQETEVQGVEAQAAEAPIVDTPSADATSDEPQPGDALDDTTQAGENPPNDAPDSPLPPSTPPSDAEGSNG